MPRPRKGTARERNGKWYWRVTLTGGRQVSREVPPRADRRPLTEAYARAYAETLQLAYDRGETTEAELRGEARPAADAPTETPPAAPELPPLIEYVRTWLKTQTYTTVPDDRRRIERYLAPTTLAQKRLDQITAQDVLMWIRWLQGQPSRRGGCLAPRSVINAYDVVRRALAFATFEHAAHLPMNPCDRLPSGSLPLAQDKHPERRSKWIFTRPEVALLCTAEVIPEYRRLEHTVLFFAGCRFGELAALRWRDLEDDVLPLGRWTLARSIERKSRVEKGTKTGAIRFVPVHPALARALARWRAEGWARHTGRAPQGDDLVVPSTTGTTLCVTSALRRFYEDQDLLGMRRRHLHCTRRTFISLARDDGGRGEILRWITHGPRRTEQTDLYSTLAWKTFCDEVVKLDVDMTPRGRLLTMPLASGDRSRRTVTGSVTDLSKGLETVMNEGEVKYQGRDLNPSLPSRSVAICGEEGGSVPRNDTDRDGSGTDSVTAHGALSRYRCEGALWAWADREAARLAEEDHGE